MFAFRGILRYLRVLVLFSTSHCSTVISRTPKSFRLLSDSSEQSLCAMDIPSVSFTRDQLTVGFASDTRIPLPETLCAWKCTNDLNCTSFNWKRTVGRCELFYYKPIACAIRCGCLHFEVGIC